MQRRGRLICSAAKDGASAGQGQDIMFTSLVLSRIKAYLTYRATIRELSLLTDRELQDIGIERYEIESVARGGAVA